jgi:hypothetical protein
MDAIYLVQIYFAIILAKQFSLRYSPFIATATGETKCANVQQQPEQIKKIEFRVG